MCTCFIVVYIVFGAISGLSCLWRISPKQLQFLGLSTLLWPLLTKLASMANVLTFAALHEMHQRREDAMNDTKTRVRVFTLSGIQIGLPGVGEKDKVLTFPRKFRVSEALRGPWIRFATETERNEKEIIDTENDGPTKKNVVNSESKSQLWWRESEVQPQCLIHAGTHSEPVSITAMTDHPMGLYGDKMTALAHAPNFDEWLSDSIRERPAGFALIDDDMSAPSTPSSGACSGY